MTLIVDSDVRCYFRSRVRSETKNLTRKAIPMQLVLNHIVSQVSSTAVPVMHFSA